MIQNLTANEWKLVNENYADLTNLECNFLE